MEYRPRPTHIMVINVVNVVEKKLKRHNVIFFFERLVISHKTFIEYFLMHILLIVHDIEIYTAIRNFLY